MAKEIAKKIDRFEGCQLSLDMDALAQEFIDKTIESQFKQKKKIYKLLKKKGLPIPPVLKAEIKEWKRYKHERKEG